MKKKYLVICFLIISSLSFSQNIIGKWDFTSILYESTKNGQNLKSISKGDAIEFKDNGDFHYEIRKENLIAHGTWTLKKNDLSLSYNLPEDTIRNYKITIDKTSLVLNENGVNFSFKKTALTSTIPTSGINLTSVLRGILGLICLVAIAFLFATNTLLF